MRFRPSIWTEGLECYLAELYVVPPLRGQGRGRALMEAAIVFAKERGADYMELNTGEDDVAARALYESLGFSSSEGKPGRAGATTTTSACCDAQPGRLMRRSPSFSSTVGGGPCFGPSAR